MSLIRNHITVQNELNIKLDSEYATFLDTYGDYDANGLEIYGYSSQYNSVDEFPCVVGATNLYRKDYQLSSSEIVISHTGYEDIVIVLNNESGKIFEISKNRISEKIISNSFNEWFAKSRDTVEKIDN